MNWYRTIISSDAIAEDDLGSKREFAGLVINVERPAGTDRYGTNKEGKEWRTTMKYDYGFISSAKGEDGEGLDVYIGPNEKAKEVYIVNQNDPKTGKFDENKCMIGFDSAADAKKAYLAHYDSPKFFGSSVTLSLKDFKKTINEHENGKVKWKKKKVK